MRPFVLSLCLLPLLTGCGINITASHIVETQTQNGAPIHGGIEGGHQSIVNAHIHLLATGTSGYGGASTSLLTSGTSGTDSIGGYVTAAADGTFSIDGDYNLRPRPGTLPLRLRRQQPGQSQRPEQPVHRPHGRPRRLPRLRQPQLHERHAQRGLHRRHGLCTRSLRHRRHPHRDHRHTRFLCRHRERRRYHRQSHRPHLRHRARHHARRQRHRPAGHREYARQHPRRLHRHQRHHPTHLLHALLYRHLRRHAPRRASLRHRNRRHQHRSPPIAERRCTLRARQQQLALRWVAAHTALRPHPRRPVRHPHPQRQHARHRRRRPGLVPL